MHTHCVALVPHVDVCCVQVMSDPAGGMTFVADPKKPVGGHVMAHASTQRIYMRKGKGEQRVAKVSQCWQSCAFHRCMASVAQQPATSAHPPIWSCHELLASLFQFGMMHRTSSLL